jgi:DNA-binding MarR family transcriptional regulator
MAARRMPSTAAHPDSDTLVLAEGPGIRAAEFARSSDLNPTGKRIYELLRTEQARLTDDIVETTGLNSSEVLATLFDLERKGIIRQLPGKQFTKVVLYVGEGRSTAASARCIGRKPSRIRNWALAARRYTYKGSEKDTLRSTGPSSGSN